MTDHPPSEPALARTPVGGLTGTFISRQHTRIGREVDNDVVIEDLLVSRHHAELHRNPAGQLTLVDVGSRNGTFVNGRRVTEASLDDNDLVAIGHTTFRVVAGMLEQYVDTGEVSFEAVGLTVPGPHGRPLLDDVSLSLDACSLCAVVGPSGSGKSTLLAALAGLRPAATGEVRYGGRDLYRDYEELRNRIGFVPQDDILHRELTMLAALEYAGRLRFPSEVTASERASRVAEVTAELGIAHRGDVPIGDLSGGERKRTSVALELLTTPSLLFLDEPASGLDPGLTRVLMRLLRQLADGGRTIIVVTHELENLHLCDRVLVLAPGGVPAYSGPPAGAAVRFGRDDLTDVFGDLSSRPEEDWREPATQHPPVHPTADRPASSSTPPRQQGWWSQLRTLSARYLAVLAADRRNAAVLALQAPVLGVLMLVALPAGELAPPDPPEVRLVSTAGLVLFVLLLGATWMGANNAVREIARELPVLRRERSVGLSLSAYVTSKVLVLGTLTVVQAVVLVAVATARQGGPTEAVLLGWSTGELMVAVALAGVASMTLALLVSALAGTAERATGILPMLLILQLVLSAGVVLPEIADRPVLREVSYLSSAQWGVAAAASTVDLGELQVFDERLRDLRSVDASDPLPAVDALTTASPTEGRFAHDPSTWLTAIGMLVLLSLTATVATTLALRRYDPGR
ncbi:MAG: ATP-binding cassette domain-containing protein [Acidimicrobiia bacterium]|nr:ATP-binding cassette domain-containing protein [Acidimicrobiia bacterium]